MKPNPPTQTVLILAVQMACAVEANRGSRRYEALVEIDDCYIRFVNAPAELGWEKILPAPLA